MGKKTQFVDRTFLSQIPLPEETNSYTTVGHIEAIENMHNTFNTHGIKVVKEEFKATNDGNIATGTFTLDIGDGDSKVMVGFVNSYNKQVSFKYGIGERIFVCDNMCILGANEASYRRKHTGDVDVQAFLSFDNQVVKLQKRHEDFKELEYKMKHISLSKKEMSELAGRLFIEEDIITATQMSILKGQIENPSYDYGDKNSTMWSFYNHTTHAGKSFHPSYYLDGHIDLSEFCINEMGILIPDASQLQLS